jgi:hypothetical protein
MTVDNQSAWIQLSESIAVLPYSIHATAPRTGSMIKYIERFMYDKVAATAVEYALIAGGLSTAIMVVAIRLAIR